METMKNKKALLMVAMMVGLLIVIFFSTSCNDQKACNYRSIWKEVYGRRPPYIDEIAALELEKK